MEPELRVSILERDRYKCHNRGCKYSEYKGTKDSILEVHHLIEQEKFRADVKVARRLGYEMDDPQNLVTLCTTCHRKYHNGALALYVKNKKYEAEVTKKYNWKQYKKEMKQLRRENRDAWAVRVPSKQWITLFVWLFGLD